MSILLVTMMNKMEYTQNMQITKAKDGVWEFECSVEGCGVHHAKVEAMIVHNGMNYLLDDNGNWWEIVLPDTALRRELDALAKGN